MPPHAIHIAAKDGDLHTISRLISQTPNLIDLEVDQDVPGAPGEDSYQYIHKETPLLIACIGGHLHIVRWLVDHGANIHHRSGYGQGALSIACSYGHPSVLSYLLSKELDPRVHNHQDFDALQVSANAGHDKCVEILLQFGRCDINDKSNSWGNTALYAACRGGYYRVVELLLAYGADPSIPSDNGRSPIDVCHAKAEKVRFMTMMGLMRVDDKVDHAACIDLLEDALRQRHRARHHR